jgi:hypothetical protein
MTIIQNAWILKPINKYMNSNFYRTVEPIGKIGYVIVHFNKRINNA